MIDFSVQAGIYAFLAETCHKQGGRALEIGGVADHVPLLARVPATIAIAQMAHDLKSASSHFIRYCLLPTTDFRWQGAYGAFSVSPEGIDAMRAYIRDQATHHTQNLLNEHWERCAE